MSDRPLELRFPAVTICNKNTLKKSKIQGKDGQLWLDGQNFKLKKDWPKIHSQINASFDIEKEVLANGHRVTDVIKEMKFSADCLKFTNTTKSFFDLRLGLCHTINVKAKVRKLGEVFGLALLLDTESHEYYGPHSWDGTGFKLMVHDPRIFPVMDLYGIDIPTGFITNLRIRKKKKIHLAEPYPARCGTKKLKSSNVYSETRCLMEQYANEIETKCGCRLIGSPVISNFNSADNACPTNCTNVIYDVQSSSIVYPSKSALDEFTQNGTDLCTGKYDFENEFKFKSNNNESYLEWFRGRYARVTIFFATTDVEIIQEMPAFDDLDLAGNVGGNMGLYLGCSILTLVEFVDLLVLVTFQWFKKKRHRVTKVSEVKRIEASDKPETT
ncbi:Acid-sensing ion channel 4 [Exaiptasia diaphana]|nr:Acid-sensing ion channel 4 [Exaiptasia diaphana]